MEELKLKTKFNLWIIAIMFACFMAKEAIEKNATIVLWLMCFAITLLLTKAYNEAIKSNEKKKVDDEIKYCYNEAQATDDAERQRLGR